MHAATSFVNKTLGIWWTWVACAINTGLFLSYLGLCLMMIRQGLLWRADFTVFYASGAMLRDGLGDRLYDLDLQAAYQQDILEGRSFSQGVLPYNHPPYLAFMFAPLSYLTLSQAYLVWTAFQLTMLGMVSLCLLHITRDWQVHERWLAVSAFLAQPGILLGLLLGNFSIWMLLSFVGWYAATRQGGRAQTAAWLLMGAAKPQTIANLGLLTLARRQWRTLGIFILGGAGLALLTWAFLGSQIWPNFLHRLLETGNYFDEYGVAPALMYNFKGALTSLLGADQASLINGLSLGGFLLSLAITWLLWRGKTDPAQPAFLVRMAFTVLLGIFFSLHLHPQDGVLIALPALLFYAYLRPRRLERRVYATLTAIGPAVLLVNHFAVNNPYPNRLPILVILGLLIWIGIASFKEMRQNRNSNTYPSLESREST